MGISKTRNRSAGLESIRQRFDHWRRTRIAGSRIPDSLWAAAARAADKHGVHRTAEALRLNYYSLKKWLERSSSAAPSPAKRAANDKRRRPLVDRAGLAPAFLELAPPAGACECTLEWENASGAKMRVHLKGVAMPDLAALSRSFWNPAP